MMKISKPVLSSEFMLSPVQFTSLNSIIFKNVKNIYDGCEKISLEYEHSSKIEASSRDWIGIFPRGWSTLQQYITFEWVSQSLPSGNSENNKENGDIIRRIINFYPKYHTASVNSSSFYQFVYVSKQIEVLGVSSYFRFDLTGTNNSALELECLVPVSSEIRFTSVSDFGILLTNNLSSSTSIGTRTLQTSSVHSLQNLDLESKTWSKAQTPLNVTDLKKTTIFSRKTHLTTGNGDALDPITSQSEPVFPMSVQMSHCKKCFHFKRCGEFLRSQQVLQSKVGPGYGEASELNVHSRTVGHEYLSKDKLKIVMERNKVLEERTQEMKKEMERLQAESKKLKMSFYNVNKEKVTYEKFVKDFIKSLEKDSIVRVVNGNTEILVKKVNYVGMEEHPRDKKTSKRERELKAVIGLQEITIRNLINSLQEKAKSMQELNQTVKLAQAFSEAREDSRDYGSDAEEALDEVSNSDVTSEYEFSLSKPQPPEEVAVEDTDTVLDDIRRATEMELKDIGINRSLGKSSSRDSISDSGLPNLSVHSYQNQSEGTRSKKPRLVDNIEDCWPFTENPTKTVHRRILNSSPNIEDNSNKNIDEYEIQSNQSNEDTMENSELYTELQDEKCESVDMVETSNEKFKINTDIEVDHSNFEDYYDACEGFSPKEPPKVTENRENFETQNFEISEEKMEDDQKDKKNFLVTAIIPQDLDIKPPKAQENWVRVEKEDSCEKEMEPVPEKRKKFTCELSIDFGGRKIQETSGTIRQAIENDPIEEPQNQISTNYDQNLPDFQIKQEKCLLTHKNPNKCVEIKITRTDQKESMTKNYVHQKMVVKFGNDAPQALDTNKTSKFEFNLALGIGDNAEISKDEGNDLYKKNSDDSDSSEVKFEEIEKSNVEGDSSPRTVWTETGNDMEEDIESITESPPDEICRPETPVDIEEKQTEVSEGSKIESSNSFDDTKANQDSLRYEKNLEFLQHKSEENEKEDEDVPKDKPTAILIQNGQTKLALIRYQ